MSSKLSAKLLALALVALAMPTLAFASSSRVEGLGLQGDYVMDYNNVFTYPSVVTQYQNLVYGDLGNKDVSGGALSDFQDNNANARLLDANRSMGAILGNLWGGRAGVWSVHFNENATPISSAMGAQYWNRNSNESWDVIWGWKAQKMSLGLIFNRTYSSFETNNGTAITRPFTGPGSFNTLSAINNAREVFNAVASQLGSDDWNSLGVGAGVSFDLGEGDHTKMLDLSGQARWMSFQFSDTTDNTVFEDNGGVSFAFNGRLHWDNGGDFHLMPVGNFYRLDLGTKFSSTSGALNPDTTYDNTVTGFQFGLVGNWKLRDSDWFWLGASYENAKIKFEDLFRNDPGTGNPSPGPDGHAEISLQNTPNIFAALESSPWNWLTIRLGAGRPLFSQLKITDKDATPEFVQKLKDSPLQYTAGVGFHFAKLDLDAVINQDFAFTGGWLASGASEVPFSKLSATYRW